MSASRRRLVRGNLSRKIDTLAADRVDIQQWVDHVGGFVVEVEVARVPCEQFVGGIGDNFCRVKLRPGAAKLSRQRGESGAPDFGQLALIYVLGSTLVIQNLSLVVANDPSVYRYPDPASIFADNLMFKPAHHAVLFE